MRFFWTPPTDVFHLDFYSEITPEVMGHFRNLFKEENNQLPNFEIQ